MTAMDSLDEEGKKRQMNQKQSFPPRGAAVVLQKGADCDRLTEGCAASAEAGSWCGSNDSCVYLDVACNHELTDHNCPVCGTSLYTEYRYPAPGTPLNHYKCNNCGYEKEGK